MTTAPALFLKGGVIQQAVNFFSFSADVYDQVRPAMDLAEHRIHIDAVDRKSVV